MVRVGVVGGGQLAWMLGTAAQAVADCHMYFQTPSPRDPVGAIASPQQLVLAPVDDAAGTGVLAQTCDVITFENEFVDLDALGQLQEAGVQFYPRLESLRPLLDKYHQRQCFQALDIPTPPFITLNGPSSADIHWPHGFPAVLKARRHGYDGKGTHIIADAPTLMAHLNAHADGVWILEAFVPFERELAVMAARSPQGDVAIYPVVETQQEDQVCRRTFTLPQLAPAITQQAEAIAHNLLTHLNFVGVLGIELFQTHDGTLLVNEIAPRTHNSGHYTIDACATSQFEQQLRAVTGRELGSTQLTCEGAVMVNLLGYETASHFYTDKRQKIEALPHTTVYWYGKSSCRPGRKMGHVTAILPSRDRSNPSRSSTDPHAQEKQKTGVRAQLEAIAADIEAIWYGSAAQDNK